MARRRIDESSGVAAVQAWQAGTADRTSTVRAVRYLLEELEAQVPGNAVEVRVPPAGVAQIVQGPRHTRGTPPNVVEMPMHTWLQLAVGEMEWADALDSGAVQASGLRSDLSGVVPLVGYGR